MTKLSIDVAKVHAEMERLSAEEAAAKAKLDEARERAANAELKYEQIRHEKQELAQFLKDMASYEVASK